MPTYRVRIDTEMNDEIRLCVIKFFNEKCDSALVVHHRPGHGENPHLHAWVDTKYTQGNFSNYIKKAFTVSKGSYANQKCDEDRKLEYFSYMFNTKKGNESTLIHTKDVPMFQVLSAQETAHTIAKEFAHKIATQKKMTKFDIAETIAQREWSGDSELYDSVVDVLHKNRMCSASFVVRDIMCTVKNMGSSKQNSAKEACLRFFSNY